MKKIVKNLLVILILIISYIIINLICGNEVFAITQTTSTDINSIDSNKYPQIKEKLESLQKEHPNWKFKILYTDIEHIPITRNKKHTIILGIQTEANLFFCNAFNFFSLLLGTL